MSSSSASTGGAATVATPIPSSGFGGSTHCRFWLWPSPAKLQSRREQAQRQSKKRIERQNRERQAAAAASNATDAATATPLQPLTLEEEKLIRLHYVLQLHQLASLLHLPMHVTHASVIFFKRFYLHQSVMEYSPKDVAYCCIYLACKAEEHHLPVDRMMATIHKATDRDAAKTAAAAASNAPSTSSTSSIAASAASAASAIQGGVSNILSLEVPVLGVLRFHMRLYHLSRSLRGVLKEVEEMDASTYAMALYINGSEPLHTQQDAPGTALHSLGAFFATRGQALFPRVLQSDDLIFLHSPAQIALALLAAMEKEAKENGIEANLAATSSSGAAASVASSLRTLDLASRFIESKIDSAVVAAPGQPIAARQQALKALRARIDEILNMMEEARATTASLDKKRLKSIEKKRKQVANPLLDPSSKLYQSAKEANGREQEEKRLAKKKKQREDSLKHEESLLMGSPTPTNRNSTAGADSDSSFLSKRFKSSPPDFHASTSDSTNEHSGAASLRTRGENLAAQFNAEMIE